MRSNGSIRVIRYQLLVHQKADICVSNFRHLISPGTTPIASRLCDSQPFLEHSAKHLHRDILVIITHFLTSLGIVDSDHVYALFLVGKITVSGNLPYLGYTSTMHWQ